MEGEVVFLHGALVAGFETLNISIIIELFLDYYYTFFFYYTYCDLQTAD